MINLPNLEKERLNMVEISGLDYKAIFENNGAPSLVIRKDDLILSANQKFAKISGYRRNDIEGKMKWTEFVIKDDCPKVENCIWQKEPPDEITDTCEFRLIDHSGEIKYFFAAITEIPSTNTAVMSLVDISDRKLAEPKLIQKDLEIEMKSRRLEEANVTLKVLLNHQQEEKVLLEEQILANFKKLIMPSIEYLQQLSLNSEQLTQVLVIKKQLQEIISPFLMNQSITLRDLTLRQAEIASLIKEGMTSRDIAKRLHITQAAVGFHRQNLRSKLGLLKNGKSLRSHLMSSS